MSNEERELNILVGKATKLPSGKWLFSLSLEGNCLNEVGSFLITDGKHVKESSSEEETRYYIDFETDAFPGHTINCKINILDQPPINEDIELQDEQQVVAVLPKRVAKTKRFLEAIKAGTTAKTEDEIAGEHEELTKLTPWSFFQHAVKAVPSIKWALGVGGITGIIAIISGLGIDLRVTGFGVIIMLILMPLLVIFAWATTQANRSIQIIAHLFLWFIFIIFVSTCVSLFSSIFFGHPVDLRGWLGVNIS